MANSKSVIEQEIIDSRLYWDPIGKDWNRLIDRGPDPVNDHNPVVIGTYRKDTYFYGSLEQPAWVANANQTATSQRVQSIFKSEGGAKEYLELLAAARLVFLREGC